MVGATASQCEHVYSVLDKWMCEKGQTFQYFKLDIQQFIKAKKEIEYTNIINMNTMRAP